jgi:type II secretory pathway component GspD/PulD (secretin)
MRFQGGDHMIRNRRLPAGLSKALILAVAIIAATLVFPAALSADEPLVTNIFDSEDIINVFRDISAQTGVNILVEPSVQGWVTLELWDVPLEKALEMIVAPFGYTFVKVGDYYLVGMPDAANPAFPLFTSTEVVRLKYANAENASRLLSDYFKPYVKTGPDENILVITGPENIISRVKEDLEKIDKAPPQVLLEALVVEVSSDTGKSLGVDWRYEFKGGEPDTSIPASGFVDFISGIWGAKYSVAGGLQSVLASMKTLVDSGKAEIHATPRVATLDGEGAEIFLGRDRYFAISTTTSEGTSTTSRLESIRTGISLKFTPRISPDTGEIVVQIEPEVSDAIEGATGLPTVNRRKVATTVRVKDGETIVIGGLNLKSQYESKTKVPVLGDLPILGIFFSSTKNVTTESEVLVFITATIISSE